MTEQPANSDDFSVEQFAEAVRWLNLDQGLREGRQLQPDDFVFINGLVQESLRRERQLVAGTLLYRARFNQDTDTDPHALAEMGMPPADRARDTRISPKGAPCLYAAFESKTATYEMRPWPMSRLTVAILRTTIALTVLDLRYDMLEGKSHALQHAAYMISRPVDPDDGFRYVATQSLGQGLKAAGARGVLYRSMLNPGGTNVAMFSETGIERVSRKLYQVHAARYTYKALS